MLGDVPPTAAPRAADLSGEEFARQWLRGLANDRALGRPKERNGEDKGFATLAFREPNQGSSIPGDVKEVLEALASRSSTIVVSEFGFGALAMAKGVMQSLKSRVDGNVLDIVRSTEKGNDFEAWRRFYGESGTGEIQDDLVVRRVWWCCSMVFFFVVVSSFLAGWSEWREHRPHRAGRKVTMLEAVMISRVTVRTLALGVAAGWSLSGGRKWLEAAGLTMT